SAGGVAAEPTEQAETTATVTSTNITPTLDARRAAATPAELSRTALLALAPSSSDAEVTRLAASGQPIEAARIALSRATGPDDASATRAAQAAAWFLDAQSPADALRAANHGIALGAANTASTSWL